MVGLAKRGSAGNKKLMHDAKEDQSFYGRKYYIK
jgi:hypothetical protein